MRFDSDEAIERLTANQALLLLPLVRAGNNPPIGPADGDWRAWLKTGQ